MAKIVVLGGCGAVGSVVVGALAAQQQVGQICVADQNRRRADELKNRLGSDKISVAELDALSHTSVLSVIRGHDLVVNCVGPFFQSVETILGAVIESGIHYVDICDDVDATIKVLAMDSAARAAGITAVIGMGNSPGATNLLAKFAADNLLDSTDSVDIFHAHGGEPTEGVGVIDHRFHCMSIDIPMFLDGKLTHVKYFEPDGIALRQTVDFPVLGNGIRVYPYPHPEQLTLPQYIDLKQVTNKGTVLPDAYYQLIQDICRLGMTRREPMDVMGTSISPHDFAVTYILRERERILRETGFGSQRGCCSVVVKGKRNGAAEEYRFHMASRSQALGEGTGIPAAIGALLMLQGKIPRRGVFPPEGCINPSDFINLISKVISLDKRKQDGESFGGVIIQRVDDQGVVTNLDW
ncbi:MAG: saccharopine dehydrogenase family protein [Thermodesulfobacteriota bacterium]